MHDLNHYLDRLSPSQRTVLARHLREMQKNRTGGQPGEHRALVAYVVPADLDRPLDHTLLREYLKERLPDYMVPATMVVLDELPRTANGKLDRSALPDPNGLDLSAERTFVPPRNEVENVLAAIWSDVLGFDRIGVYDNFFEIGGDSILSIQIVARARQAGLRLTPAQLLQHQTIARLATVVEAVQPLQRENETAIGPAILTPIQHWFFEQPLAEPNHWNHVLWLDGPPGLHPGRLRDALDHVAQHHDVFGLRFSRNGTEWQPHYAEEERSVVLDIWDVTALSDSDLNPVLEEHAGDLNRQLDLARGILFRAALFRHDRTPRLLLVAHHLIVDPISWPIILEDLNEAYRNLGRGEPATLQPNTTSYRQWANALKHYGERADVRAESSYWQTALPERCPPVPVDESGDFTENSAETWPVILDEQTTRTLLLDVHEAYNTNVEDLLLAALVLAMETWTGKKEVLIGLERHGRDPIEDGQDLSRTVGWFTSFFPVLLSPAPDLDLSRTLKTVKEQLRGVPQRGIGYGVLRYLEGDARPAVPFPSHAQPEILFNYTGKADIIPGKEAAFKPVGILGSSRGPENRRTHRLEINAYVASDRLRIDWTYSTRIHRRETIERIGRTYLEILNRLITHCLSSEATGFTPSDFPEAGLNQDELDRLFGRLLS